MLILNLNKKVTIMTHNKSQKNYEDSYIIIDKNPETMERYKDLVPMFELMAELSEILRERRYKRGAIDFEFPECKIKLNQGGNNS